MNWARDGLTDLMKQGIWKSRKAGKTLPYTLTPINTGRKPGSGTGLLYDISAQGRVGKIGRALGGSTPNFYVIVNDEIASEGHRTAAQAAKWFVSGRRKPAPMLKKVNEV